MTAQFHTTIRSAKSEAEALSAMTGYEHIIRPTTGGFTVHMTATTIFDCPRGDTRDTTVLRARHVKLSRKVGRLA